MAQLTTKELQKRIASERPGYDVVPVTHDELRPDALDEPVDQVPDLEDLRREFLGDPAEEFDVEGDMVKSPPKKNGQTAHHDDVRVFRTSPKGPDRDALDRGPGDKTILVSGDDGSVLAEQG